MFGEMLSSLTQRCDHEQPMDPRPAGRPAVIEVSVPSDAELWFDGTKTAQQGPGRVFLSPPLPPGSSYHYVLRARWTRNGAPFEQMRVVAVTSGERARVAFPLSEAR